MSIFIQLLLVTAIICFIVDVSGFINDGLKPLVAKIVSKRTNIKVNPEDIVIHKPWICSLCLTFWISIGYIIIMNQFTLVNLAYICLLALMSSNISELLMQAKDVIAWVQMKVNKLLKH